MGACRDHRGPDTRCHVPGPAAPGVRLGEQSGLCKPVHCRPRPCASGGGRRGWSQRSRCEDRWAQGGRVPPASPASPCSCLLGTVPARPQAAPSPWEVTMLRPACPSQETRPGARAVLGTLEAGRARPLPQTVGAPHPPEDEGTTLSHWQPARSVGAPGMCMGRGQAVVGTEGSPVSLAVSVEDTRLLPRHLGRGCRVWGVVGRELQGPRFPPRTLHTGSEKPDCLARASCLTQIISVRAAHGDPPGPPASLRPCQ